MTSGVQFSRVALGSASTHVLVALANAPLHVRQVPRLSNTRQASIGAPKSALWVCASAQWMCAIIGAVAWCGASAAAWAGDICVTCVGPEATYRCAVEGDEAKVPVDQGMRLACIKELAARAGHQSCSVDRVQSGDCAGVLVSVVRERRDAPAAPVSPQVPETQAAVPGVGIPAPQPPETMEKLAQQAAAQSQRDLEATSQQMKDGTKSIGKAVEGVGAGIGNAAQKSWTCVTSLFTRC